MKHSTFCLVLLLFSFSCKKSTSSEITIIDKDFLLDEVVGKNVQLVDVRTQEEYESGHIEGAINFNVINNETFLEQIDSLNKDEPVYLYCKMGGRSNRAAQLLKDQGFTRIYDYSAGYNDWVID